MNETHEHDHGRAAVVTAEYEPSPSAYVADHVQRYESSGGEDGALMSNGSGVVILTTRGRRSGKLRKTPLVRVTDGGNYVVIASMGGAPAHPNWYLNLVDEPAVTIQDGDQLHELRARTVAGQERARMWALAVEQWPDYEEYQQKTQREIPVVALEKPGAS
jgi:deazaflavin-dependent oxidoreductase (nitroreductase family)